MALYELKRHPEIARFDRWWAEAVAKAPPRSMMAAELASMKAGQAVVLAEGPELRRRFEWYEEIPGWDILGFAGHPIAARKVPIAEERQIIESIPREDRSAAAEHCSLDPQLPRAARREASKAEKKLAKLRAKRRKAVENVSR